MQRKLGDILIDLGLISTESLAIGLERQRLTSKPLGEVLVTLGFLTDSQLQEALADQQDVDTWDLEVDPPEKQALDLVTRELCARHHALPVRVNAIEMIVAMRNPGDYDAIDSFGVATRRRIRPVQANDKQLELALITSFGPAGMAVRTAEEEEKGNAFDSFVMRAMDEFGEEEKQPTPVLNEEETRPVIGLVNQIVADAIKMRASDIHIEPRPDGVEIRYRIDGRLTKIRELPRALLPMVVARVKIMADMDVADHRLPQDGRIEVRNGTKAVDLRVSSLPNYHGNRLVLRILDRSSILRSLDELGFSSNNLVIFRDLVEKPYGIVLVTGPTGSGKTTTLYAALNELKSETRNIMTCEDPVEYDLHGINQSQVHEKIGLTFAAQLRSILRQDPDVVLVGEIRDKETAETAIRASLTGHLVLSTLHCNDAPSAIPRLLDMGIEPFLLSTSLVGVVAQRLLRVLCPECRGKGAATERDRAVMRAMGIPEQDQVWQPVGCPTCNGLGYAGRTGVHEILPISEELSHLIATGARVDEIRDAGAKTGYRTMQEDALNRVQAGQTTYEEARRLISFNTLKAQLKQVA